MTRCEGPIVMPDKRQRWLCHGRRTTLRTDLYKKTFSFKPWCVEGDVISGVFSDPVAGGCFGTRPEAEMYMRTLHERTSSTLAGLRCGCSRRRKR